MESVGCRGDSCGCNDDEDLGGVFDVTEVPKEETKRKSRSLEEVIAIDHWLGNSMEWEGSGERVGRGSPRRTY
uniref:Uncharacterized protein n=1 Tax=Cucumis melo TaxID=3656 RepID=A0A9I9CRN9_CUCME